MRNNFYQKCNLSFVLDDCHKLLPPHHEICSSCAGAKQCVQCTRKLRRACFDDNTDVCKTCMKSNLQAGGSRPRSRHLLTHHEIDIDRSRDESLRNTLIMNQQKIKQHLENELLSKKYFYVLFCKVPLISFIQSIIF